MIFHVLYKNRISILREGVRLGCNLYWYAEYRTSAIAAVFSDGVLSQEKIF